ncbi:hypothetical protein DUT91_00030 [Phyllobacterium salinisoli]|uniref:Uncharacterized protein n=1 Tax=Phyllobacterium salinisoli TaxID=1899321 RepID=A0A368K7C2_9HYPH|nr:hypothetical protein [Phyllobacterium salinisoli]RCS25256.1 hypothetical protein DUT91_00030 [Phyllobacterium salinisoli]
MRRKSISNETKVLIFRAILHMMWNDRTSSQEATVTAEQVCNVAAQCGIDPHLLGWACAIEFLWDGEDSRVLIDELDSALISSFGEDYSFEFLHHLTGERHHIEKKLGYRLHDGNGPR